MSKPVLDRQIVLFSLLWIKLLWNLRVIHLTASEPLRSLINGFADDDSLIRAVSSSETDNLWWGVFQAVEQNFPVCVKIMLNEISQRSLQPTSILTLALNLAAQRGQLQNLKQLLDFEPPHNVEVALWGAASGGHLSCMSLLLPYFKPVLYDPNYALEAAVRHNNPQGVKLLLSVCDPSLNNWEIVNVAVRNNNTESLRALIPDIHPQAPDTYDVLTEVLDIHSDLLKLCVQIFDARSNPNALAQAVHYGYLECVEVLFPISDVPRSIDLLRQAKSSHLEAFESRWQKHTLNSHIEGTHIGRQRKM